MPEKAVKQLDLRRFTWDDSEFPTIRSAAVLECAACIDSPHGLGGARSIGHFQVIQLRKFRALFGVMIDYKPECQQGGNS
jgi:hypothetical protein